MKQWTVTYREKSGLKTSVIIEAEDRAGVFAELKQRGINAISITEGVVKAKRRAARAVSNSVGMSKILLWATAVVVILFAGMVGYFWMGSQGVRDDDLANKNQSELLKGGSDKNKQDSKNNEAHSETGIKTSNLSLSLTNATDIASNKKTAVEPPKSLPPQNVSTAGVIRINGVVLTPRKLFKTKTENYIADLMTVEPGEMVLGVALPPNFDEEFMASYATPISFDPEDTEDDKAIKMGMKQLKEDMLARIKAGESPSSIILEERKELQRLHDYRQTIMVEVGRLKREGASEDEIEDAVAAANKMLEEKGAKLILSPRAVKERLRNLRLNQNPGGYQ